ncbi:MAG: hypothetical protein QW639_02370 [Candidatus Bathyarchaeia archaeon]
MYDLKREFLELLDKDVEFRYTVAGYLGLSEILKRLDTLSEEQVKLREEQKKIWVEIAEIKEEQRKIWVEIVEIKEEQKLLREEQKKIWVEIAEIKEEQKKIWVEIAEIKEEQKSLREEQKRLGEEQKSLREEQVKLREDFNRMLAMINRMDRRLTRVERTLDKLTLDVEDEARSIVRKRIKDELGFDIKLGSLALPDMEVNIYGVSKDVCVVGEATVRGGVEVLRRLLRNIKRLKERHPERLRDRMIPVIYVCQPMPELVERAEKQDIWTLKATEDFYKPRTIIWSSPPKNSR